MCDIAFIIQVGMSRIVLKDIGASFHQKVSTIYTQIKERYKHTKLRITSLAQLKS